MKAKHVIPHIQFTQLIKFVLHGAEFSWKVFNTEADVPLLRGLTCGGGGPPIFPVNSRLGQDEDCYYRRRHHRRLRQRYQWNGDCGTFYYVALLGYKALK